MKTARVLGLSMAFFAILLVPGLIIGYLFVHGAASVFLFGGVPVAAAFFGGARKEALPIIALSVIAGTLAQVFQGSALLLALLVAAVGMTIGMTARRGLSSPILMVGIVTGFLVMSPPELGQGETPLHFTLNPTLSTAILLLLGGLWALLVSSLVHKKTPSTLETGSRQLSELIPYALALTVSTGVATYFLVRLDTGSMGAWLILTIFVVLKPDGTQTIERTRSRILGTLAGAVIAFVIIEILQLTKNSEGLVQAIIALLFIGISMAYYKPGPYWKYVMFLTPGIVLIDSNSVSDQTTVDAMRVVFTLIGIALALATGYLASTASRLFFAKDSVASEK